MTHQHSIFHNQSHPSLDSAAPSLPSRQSLRVISSSHAQPPRASFLDLDASAAAVHNASQVISHIPRPATAAAAVSSASKEAHVPDGRFEFVGASIADGRRKQLARPSTAVRCLFSVVAFAVPVSIRTACYPRCIKRTTRHHCIVQHPSRPGRRQHAAVAHLFDAKQAVTGNSPAQPSLATNTSPPCNLIRFTSRRPQTQRWVCKWRRVQPSDWIACRLCQR